MQLTTIQIPEHFNTHNWKEQLPNYAQAACTPRVIAI